LDYAQLDDSVLLGLIVDARADALNELYSRYGRLVYGIALHVVGDRAAAEEIALDIFTKVWEKADSYRSDRGSVRVWISSMTRNRAIDVLRKENVRSDVRRRVWAENTSLPITHERNPESAADLNMRKERLLAAINELSVEQRKVLALAYFQGYTQSEIAQLCDLPLGTVKTRIRSGIQKLRQLLQEDQSG
jgi:RNA polymerase sigma-70 factor, ECF subfamily